MAAVTFDTLKLADKLKSAGIPEEQARAMSEAFRDAQSEAELVTKSDLREFELKVEAKIDKLDTRLGSEMTLLKWMLGLLLGGVLALVLKAFFPL